MVSGCKCDGEAWLGEIPWYGVSDDYTCIGVVISGGMGSYGTRTELKMDLCRWWNMLL